MKCRPRRVDSSEVVACGNGQVVEVSGPQNLKSRRNLCGAENMEVAADQIRGKSKPHSAPNSHHMCSLCPEHSHTCKSQSTQDTQTPHQARGLPPTCRVLNVNHAVSIVVSRVVSAPRPAPPLRARPRLLSWGNAPPRASGRTATLARHAHESVPTLVHGIALPMLRQASALTNRCLGAARGRSIAWSSETSEMRDRCERVHSFEPGALLVPF